MRKIMTLAALAAVLWVGAVGAQQQQRIVATTKAVEDTYTKLTNWFPIASQPQGALIVYYTGNVSVAATDTVRLFLKATLSDTTETGAYAVVGRDVWHSNVANGTKAAAVLDTLAIKFNPRAGVAITAWSIPLPAFIYPGSYVSLWGGRDSTNGSIAEVTIYHVGTPIE